MPGSISKLQKTIDNTGDCGPIHSYYRQAETARERLITIRHVRKKRRHSFLYITLITNVYSFVIFGMNHPEDLFFYENRKFILNIITSLRSDDVILTSSETTLSRTTSGKDTTIF